MADDRRMAFAALFPPLLAADDDADVEEALDEPTTDIGVEELLLPPLEKAVDAGIYRALHHWNDHDPVQTDETTLSYLERVKKYQRIAAIALHGDANSATEEDGEGPESADNEDQESGDGESAATRVAKVRAKEAAERRKARARRKEKKQREAERACHRASFDQLPDITALRAERQPSARLQQFVATYKPKKRRLVQKRSLGDTVTSMSFEFARPAPDPMEDTDNASKEQQSSLAVDSDLDLDPVLWLEVLHPSKDPARTQSFLVRRSQRLCELVDLVACAYDERLREHEKASKLVYFSRKFFVDRRVPGSVDYSAQIRAWIRAKPERETRFGSFSKDDYVAPSLHDATFADLELEVDEPGVYIHQGECEHVLRLRDARLPHALDATTRDGVFPLRLPNPLFRPLRNCFVCLHYSAKFVCYGDRLATSDPMFFCERCYRAAHYDKDGNLLYDDFQSFPFVQE